MISFIIEKTNSTPLISFNDVTKTLNIEGISLPENPFIFYSEVYDFIDRYQYDEITIMYNLTYANSSTSKCIIMLLKKCIEKIKNINIYWVYDLDDDDIKETGEDIQSLLNLNVNFVPKNN